jgi:hypothetical protein
MVRAQAASLADGRRSLEAELAAVNSAKRAAAEAEE